MVKRSFVPVFAFLLATLSSTSSANAQTGQQPPPTPPQVNERVEVVATRLPEVPSEVPAAIEVFTASELHQLGVVRLGDALALATGVDVTPGGDAGPAGSVPEFLGLREFDAFLLVVDGVPWGGAFNPALTTMSLVDVERIEILRGPAPVTYGATSFVGVIHIVHRQASAKDRTLALRGGAYGSGGAAFSFKLPSVSWDSRLAVDFEREGFKDDRTSYVRGHALWRNTRGWGKGHLWFNADLNWLDQNPASPSPREGGTLSPLVPVDANHNPDGAFINDRRFSFMVGFDRPLGSATWTTIGSVSHLSNEAFRGFLQTLDNVPGNARGLRADISTFDLYVDSHGAWSVKPDVTLVAGGDFLHGNGSADGADFTYTAPLDGSSAPVVTEPSELDIHISDRREFAGAYASAEWRPRPRLRIDGGLRLNLTFEEREGDEGQQASAEEEAGHTQSNARLSGAAGAMWTAWEQGADRLGIYAAYRNTFKPAAVDFGIGEAEQVGGETILDPETAQHYEIGMKARLANGRVLTDAEWFLMDFRNLVIAQVVNGLPALANVGTERFKGFEAGATFVLPSHINGRATYAFHDARFRDYLTEFDGEPTQLAGKRLEMSPRHLASGGLFYSPDAGVTGGFEVKIVGSRYLNKRNTALADAFATLDINGGFRTGHWDLRVFGRNLTDQRDPSAESELGDAQYYRMPSRRFDVIFTRRF